MYATERKQTKIEFPEAKILEETLNCTLYQNTDTEMPESLYQYYDDSAPMWDCACSADPDLLSTAGFVPQLCFEFGGQDDF